MTTRAKFTFGRGTFLYQPPEGDPVELVCIVDAGPLCVGRAYDHMKKETVGPLHWIYLKRQGARIGPWFWEFSLAERAIRKMLKQFGKAFFEQPLEWIRRQEELRIWMERNVGNAGDAVGFEWRKEDD